VNYQFKSSSLANMYRHIGDAVPPLISFQIANVCRWILTNEKPVLGQCVLEGCSLVPGDIVEVDERVEQLRLAM
jgi:DNA (cytosine-5)-methyltransferase 1